MKIEWKQCFKIGISIFSLFLCISYWKTAAGFISVLVSAMSPLIIGIVIAYLLNILMAFYERYYFKKFSDKKIVAKSKRVVCLFLAIVTMIAVIAILVYMIIPELVSCFTMLMEKIPGIIDDLSKNPYVKEFMPKDIMKELNNLDWESYAQKIGGFLTTGAIGAVDTVANVATSVFSSVVSGTLGFIFALYFLISKEKLINQFKRLLHAYLKEEWYSKIMYYAKKTDECFHQYIVGKIIDAVILGVMCAVGMAIFRFPFAVMIGALIGFTALIPVAGAYIGGGIGAFMIFTVSPVKALLFIVFLVVLQQIEGNLIYPKIMSSSVGLPGVWVLAAITVGGSLSGIVGMLIGVPIVAVVYQILQEEVLKKEKAECESVETEEVTEEETELIEEDK